MFARWHRCPGQAKYHVSQYKKSEANTLSRPNPHLPWGSLPGFTSESCHFTNFIHTWREGMSMQGGRAPFCEAGPRIPIFVASSTSSHF